MKYNDIMIKAMNSLTVYVNAPITYFIGSTLLFYINIGYSCIK